MQATRQSARSPLAALTSLSNVLAASKPVLFITGAGEKGIHLSCAKTKHDIRYTHLPPNIF